MASSGEILKQSISPGTKVVPEDTEIILTVSKGTEQVYVPDFTGQSYEIAKKELKRLDLPSMLPDNQLLNLYRRVELFLRMSEISIISMAQSLILFYLKVRKVQLRTKNHQKHHQKRKIQQKIMIQTFPIMTNHILAHLRFHIVAMVRSRKSKSLFRINQMI